MTKIRSTLQAIGIITEEVRKMADKRHRDGPDKCVECGARVTHPGAYFCEECAVEFYDGNACDGCSRYEAVIKYEDKKFCVTCFQINVHFRKDDESDE